MLVESAPSVAPASELPPVHVLPAGDLGTPVPAAEGGGAKTMAVTPEPSSSDPTPAELAEIWGVTEAEAADALTIAEENFTSRGFVTDSGFDFIWADDTNVDDSEIWERFVTIYGNGNKVGVYGVARAIVDGAMTIARNSQTETGFAGVDLTKVSNETLTDAVWAHVEKTTQDGGPREQISVDMLSDAVTHITGDVDGFVTEAHKMFIQDNWADVELAGTTRISGEPGPTRFSKEAVHDIWNSGALSPTDAPDVKHVEIQVLTSASPGFSVEGGGLSPVQREGLEEIEEGAPVSAQDIVDIHDLGAVKFYETISATADGTDTKILANLIAASGMSTTELMKGEVNTDLVNTDMEVLLQDPDIQTLMADATDEAVIELYGPAYAAVPDATDALAQEQADYLLSPEVVEMAKDLPEDYRTFAISDGLHRISYFDPALAKETFEQLTPLILEAMASESAEEGDFSKYDLTDMSYVVEQFIEPIVGVGRFVSGGQLLWAESLRNLHGTELTEVSGLFAKFLTLPPATRGHFADFAIHEGASDAAVLAATDTWNKLESSGKLGSFWGALAGASVVMDFTGGDEFSDWSHGLQTTADIMQLVAGAGGYYNLWKSFTTDLGVNLDALGSQQTIAGAYQMMGRAGDAPGALEAVNDLITAPHVGAEEIVTTINESPLLRETFSGEIAQRTGLEGAELATEVDTFIDHFAASVFSYQTSFPGVVTNNGNDFTETLSALADADPVDVPDLADLEVFDDLDPLANYENRAITLEDAQLLEENTLLSTNGELLTAEQGELMRASSGAIVEENVASGLEVGSAASEQLGQVLKGLGMLGTSANFLYAAKAGIAAAKDFEEGDIIGGTLNSATSAAFTTGGVAGLYGTFSGSAVAAEFASGAIWVALGMTVLDLVYEEFEQYEQYEDNVAFLRTGVGNGVDYYKDPSVDVTPNP